MALNYQRNSYKLWEAATQAWMDESTKWIFDPARVADADFTELQTALLKHRVALQPNKHPQTWQKICFSISRDHGGKFENLLELCRFDIARIKALVQGEAKRGFPYLAGAKICNYWLYVLTQYTDYPLCNRAAITIAPDTHVVQASRQLGVISADEFLRADVQRLVDRRWQELLHESGLEPIDMHTPLWLWSRAGFPAVS